MNEPGPAPVAAGPRPSTRFPVLLVLFAASGCAALIYEIVWFQLLELVIGSTAVSMAVLLGTYMGGMGLGSLLLPRLLSRRRHPLRVYAGLEIAIGAAGIFLLFGMPLVVKVYTAHSGLGAWSLVMRGAVSAACLLVPTMAMGATLPAVSRWVEAAPRGVSWMGFLYGGNTAGGVLGCLLAGFYLLRVHDTMIATFAAALINGLVAAAALFLAARGPRWDGSPGPEPGTESAARRNAPVYVAIALSGFCALGAEVVWTRLLSLLLGGTVYAFSIILAVFLAGLGLGGGAGAALARGKASPRTALAVCQVLLTAAIAWTAFLLAKSLPYWPINTTLSRSPWTIFQLDLLRCLWAVLAPAILWGASFPLALAAAVPGGRDSGRTVGGVYASNTAGAILGAVLFSLLFVPGLGTQNSQRLMIGFCLLAGLAAIAPSRRRKPPDTEGPGAAAPGISPRPRILDWAVPGVAAVLLAGAVLAWSVPKVPGELVAWGRSLPIHTAPGQVLYVGEGLNSSVAVTRIEGGILNFHVSGKVEASSDPTDMRLERMLGHIPAILHPRPRSVLVVGCGAGVTAGSFVLYPGVERIVICEIEPLIPKVVARFFGEENYDVLDDPRVRVVYDDARHYILTTGEKFDIITSDPIHPWIKGSAALYSREYFELCKAHLNPGGLITQWVPLYESTPETVKSELATFFKVFPEGTIWGNDVDGLGYDVVLLGGDGPLAIDLEALEARLARADYQAVSRSLGGVGFQSALALFSCYAGRGPDLLPWLKDAPINRDRNMRLQYLAGLGLNTAQSIPIFEEMLGFRKFPTGLFTGPEAKVAAIKEFLGPRRK